MKYLKKITLSLLTFVFAFLIFSKSINLKAQSEINNLLSYRDTQINLEAGPGNGAFIRFQIDHVMEVDQLIIKNLDKVNIDKTTIVSGLSSYFDINGNITKLNTYSTIPNEITMQMSEDFETLVFMILTPDGTNKQLYAEYFMDTVKIYGKLHGRYVAKEVPENETLYVQENYETEGDYAVQKIVLDQEKDYYYKFYNFMNTQFAYNQSPFYQELDDGVIVFEAIFNYYTYKYDIYITGKDPWLNVDPGFSITFRYSNDFEVIEIYDFASLPNTIGNFENELSDRGTVFVQKSTESFYNIKVYYNKKIYSINVNNVPEYILNSKQVYYFTDSGSRYFVGFYEFQDHYKEASSIEQNLIDNSWIYWNLNNGEFMRSEINVVRGLISVNRAKIYATVVIPHESDDLVSIVVEYDYQYKYLNGSVGAWQKTINQSLNKDIKTYVQNPWYLNPLGFQNFILKKTNLFSELEIIEVEMYPRHKENFVRLFNLYNEEQGLPHDYTESQLFPNEFSSYRLYLGSHTKWWSIGLNVKDFGVVAYRYVYNGVEYSNPYPKTEVPDYYHKNPIIDDANDFFAKVKTFFTKVWSTFLNYATYLIPVVALVSYPIIFKGLQGVFGNKIKKQRTLIFIIYLGLLYLAWFLLIR